ncbi:MAG: cell division protein FtsL [Acidobacteria bacterium]|nr:cell division protein FtsL [Acidobacteriota bacterium]
MASDAQLYWVKRIDNSRLLRQRQRARWRDSASLLAVALICLAVGLLCAWQHFRYLDCGYRLEELRAQVETAREWNRTLRLEQASLRDPMRIDALARLRLGLEAPLAGQWQPVGEAGTASAAPVLAQHLPATRVSVTD